MTYTDIRNQEVNKGQVHEAFGDFMDWSLQLFTIESILVSIMLN